MSTPTQNCSTINSILLLQTIQAYIRFVKGVHTFRCHGIVRVLHIRNVKCKIFLGEI